MQAHGQYDSGLPLLVYGVPCNYVNAGRPASSRLQQVAESGDDDDCASVDIPNELEGFDSLMVASQTSMMSASQHSLSSPPGSGSGGRIRSRDLSKGDHDQLSTGRDIGAESCGSGQGARTDGSVMLEDNDDDDDEGEEAEDFLMTTKPSPTRERRRGGAMGAAGERGRETGVTDDASLSKDSKALARNEVTANRKRAREEAVSLLLCCLRRYKCAIACRRRLMHFVSVPRRRRRRRVDSVLA